MAKRNLRNDGGKEYLFDTIAECMKYYEITDDDVEGGYDKGLGQCENCEGYGINVQYPTGSIGATCDSDYACLCTPCSEELIPEDYEE